MSPVLAQIVDLQTLWQAIWSAAVAGIGVSVVFAFTVVGVTRSGDMRRDQRMGASLAYGLLAVAGMLATAGSVVYAIVLITSK